MSSEVGTISLLIWRVGAMRYVNVIISAAALAALGSLALAVGAVVPSLDRAARGGGIHEGHFCMLTPTAWMPSPCGCPTSNHDFCSEAVPRYAGTDVITAYYCEWDGEHTCTDWQEDCGFVMYCTCYGGPCDCDGEDVLYMASCHPTKPAELCTGTYLKCSDDS
jgi:hypothetical protein